MKKASQEGGSTLGNGVTRARSRKKGDRHRSKVTITDVARAAGVSTATVSRVLNSHSQVDPRLAEAVRRTVKELNYRPSRVARTLRTRQSRVWVLIISDVRNPFFTDMVRGVEDIAYSAGYSLVLCNAEEDLAKETSYLELAVAENVGGVILTPVGSATNLAPLMQLGVPVVLADRSLSPPFVDSVTVNNAAGAYAAIDHLITGGYRRIACITGPLSKTTGSERYVGYCEALKDADLAEDERLVRVADFREAGGQRAMQELLALDDPPDAVFVANNVMTIGALQAIAKAHLEIPRDIAVIGFDDMSWSSLLRPPLTTVAQPTYDLGVETGRLLLSRLEGYSGAARTVVLSPSLVVRASSAAKSPAAKRR
jgi:LacI family transcriptional regulator